MKAQAIATAARPTLTVEKGIAEYNHEIKKLTNTAWHIAYTALWNTLEFSAHEKAADKAFISNFLQQGNHHQAQYLEFVQRVLLARLYVISHPGTWIPLPSQWFDGANTRGFCGTSRWYNAILQTRQCMPLYRQALKAFAEAIFETTQEYDPKDFHYWRSYFIQQNAQGLLNLYLSTIAQCCLSGHTLHAV